MTRKSGLRHISELLSIRRIDDRHAVLQLGDTLQILHIVPDEKQDDAVTPEAQEAR